MQLKVTVGPRFRARLCFTCDSFGKGRFYLFRLLSTYFDANGQMEYQCGDAAGALICDILGKHLF